MSEVDPLQRCVCGHARWKHQPNLTANVSRWTPEAQVEASKLGHCTMNGCTCRKFEAKVPHLVGSGRVTG